MITKADIIKSKEASNEYFKDTLSGIKYDIEKILEKIEGQTPEGYNYSFLEEFLSSITSGSIQARKLADHMKQEVKNGRL